MKLIGYKSNWTEKEGLVPTDIQDIQLVAEPDEIRSLIDFLSRSLDQFENGNTKYRSIDFQDSKKNSNLPTTIGISPDANSAL